MDTKTVSKDSDSPNVQWVKKELDRGFKGMLLYIPDEAERQNIHLKPEELEQNGVKDRAIQKIGELLSSKEVEIYSIWSDQTIILKLRSVVEMFGIKPEELKQYKTEAIEMTSQIFSDKSRDKSRDYCYNIFEYLDNILEYLEVAIEMFGIKPEDRQPLKDKALENLSKTSKSTEYRPQYTSYVVKIAKILDIKSEELGPYKDGAIIEVGNVVSKVLLWPETSASDYISDIVKIFGIKPKELEKYRQRALAEIDLLLRGERIPEALRLAQTFGILKLKEEVMGKFNEAFTLLKNEIEANKKALEEKEADTRLRGGGCQSYSLPSS